MTNPLDAVPSPDLPGIQPSASPAEFVASELNVSNLTNLSHEEARLLVSHIQVFSETTNKLLSAHQVLQDQIRTLGEELEVKNRQLESINNELQRRIQETEAVRDFLNRVIDSMQSGLIVTDVHGFVTRMNRAAQILLGIDEIPCAPITFDRLLAPSAPNPVTRLLADPSQPVKGETRFQKPDQAPLLVRYAAVSLPTAGETATPEGNAGVLVVFEDLSQIRLLEEKLRRSDRLTALGELAAGVAHELRNPLATLRGYIQLLPTEYEDPDFRQECSTRLIREIDRLARLTDDLLELSRPIREDHSGLSIQDLMQEVLTEQLDSLKKENIELQWTHEEVLPIPADRDRLKQVFLNLVINARQAMPNGGILRVHLGLCKMEWGKNEDKRDFLMLSISDTGVGIESRHLDSVFDPFFTTKDEGTGLGLALCHRIIEEHGGTIHLQSTAGKGSTFTLYLPVVRDSYDNRRDNSNG